MASICDTTPSSSTPGSDPVVVAPTSPMADVDPIRPSDLRDRGLSWYVVLWIAGLHVGALLAFLPQFFSWWAVGLAFVLHWVSGGVGVCLGFHRLFTHASFRTYPAVRYLLAICGGLAGEGSCLCWVANHRKHHAYSDKLGDPHSPHDGAWWSHMLWTMVATVPERLERHHKRWIPDLIEDRGLRLLDAMFLPIHIGFGLMLLGVGYLAGGWTMAWSFVIWGMFVRLVLVLHSTWFVNSASHMWGYRNYQTTDDSRNNWWVAAITYGEGWHNNHHAYPRMARHGHRWWEIDVTFLTIRLMQLMGIAWDVVDNQHLRGNTNNLEPAAPVTKGPHARPAATAETVESASR